MSEEGRKDQSRERPAAGGAGGWRHRDSLWLAVAIGLTVGVVEVLALGWRALVRGALTHVTPDVIWMAPVAYAALFLALCPLVIGVQKVARRRGGAAAPFAVFAGLGLVGWLSMLPWAIHPAAVWILAFGIAARAGITLGRRGRALAAAARGAAVGLALIVAGGAAVLAARERAREGAALEALGPVDDARPNVLLLVLDTVRAKSLGLYGGPAETSSRMAGLARDAVVFDRAISTAPWTLPSHASMFTGRWPHELSVGWSAPLDDAEPTLAERLAAEGYATAGFVANLAYGARLWGLDRGFAHYEDFPVSLGQTVLATGLGRALATTGWIRDATGYHDLLNRKTAGTIREDLLAWLDARPDRPFFAFANFYDAHDPYEPPDPWRERFAAGFERRDVEHRQNLLRGVNARRERRWTMTEEERAGELGLYEGAIAYLDDELGRIFDGLAERGLLESTIVIVTSDHGEQHGEHDMFDHMQSLYQPLTHVPLVIRPPGGAGAHVRVVRPVSLIDLPATVLDLTGSAGRLPGSSLAPLWRSDAPDAARVSPAVSELGRGLVEQPWYPIARGLDMQSMVSGTLKYICNPDATEELYDLASDPDELENLVGTSAGDGAALAFRSAIAPVGAPPTWCPPPAEEAPRRPEPRR